jgi:hypothetical protein
MKKTLRFSSLAVIAAATATPLIAAAQINVAQVKGYSDSIIGIINNILVPVLMAVAFIVFLYGIFNYFILGGSSDAERAKGKQFALWGIIGFVIILSVWGLVAVVGSVFGLSLGGGSPTPPTFGSPSAPASGFSKTGAPFL